MTCSSIKWLNRLRMAGWSTGCDGRTVNTVSMSRPSTAPSAHAHCLQSSTGRPRMDMTWSPCVPSDQHKESHQSVFYLSSRCSVDTVKWRLSYRCCLIKWCSNCKFEVSTEYNVIRFLYVLPEINMHWGQGMFSELSGKLWTIVLPVMLNKTFVQS